MPQRKKNVGQAPRAASHLVARARTRAVPRAADVARAAPGAARMVEDIVGCKWSLAVLDRVRRGVRRPGAIEASLHGLSTKVMNERLRKLVRYGILARTAYPEVPPRVEYTLTAYGGRFARVLDEIAALDADTGAPARRGSRPAPAVEGRRTIVRRARRPAAGR